ncbi:MAG TPA: phosphatidate cytidylyltransferase [Ornithinimicrobium sp.]|uniref:phosphatidate cytidylyltransferase n=1 Tax=Ornithinimicrobium sp. TaxID=1977084 RepID=UPI002B45A7DF|nr:phosphatidate cytidylyltransferase [Ornithinimicrobium sp.]HKJ11621.1 phosphatidate cytidylyltransferase [Ornithinimicrobium sp.]
MTDDSEGFTRRRDYPAAAARPAPADPAATTSRAGRDLRAAIGVGVGLGAVVLATLLLSKPLFVAVTTVGIVLGVYELIQALRAGRIEAPPVPTLAAAVTLMPLAYVGGTEALAVGFACFCLAILVWRAALGAERAVRDTAGGIFITAYVPLMSGLAALLVSEADGVARIVVFILVTICSDIGGYAVGVMFGRHPMAPSLSPKKSWEGFAGSVLSCVLAGVLSVVLLLDGAWWVGVLLGVAVACFATLGDLAESTLKRDLGIKDMGSTLPGHGGLMDRLDSLVMTLPVTFAILTAFVPA